MGLSDFDDSEDLPLYTEMSKHRKASCVRECAFEIFMCSVKGTGGEPTISPEKAFTLAEEFLTEAGRRGY